MLPPSSTPARRHRNTLSAEEADNEAYTERMQKKQQLLQELRRQRDEIVLTKEIEEHEKWIQDNQLPPSIDSAYARHTPSPPRDRYSLQVMKDYRSGYRGPSLSSYKLSDELDYAEFMRHLCLMEGLPIKWGENEENTLCNEADYQLFLESRGDKRIIRVWIYEEGGEIDDPGEGWEDL